MNEKLTAEKAIKNLKNTNGIGIMGYEFKRVLPTHIRQGLQETAEAGEITGKEYWRALKITFPLMSDCEKNLEELSV